ncbi:MAG: deoxyribose-phosphate aldolase [Saprospiraceae bacterium]
MKIESPLEIDSPKIASHIDHTILKPNCTLENIQTLCTEANEHGFISVCIPPYFTQHASRLLEKSDVKIATVIGFPMGYTHTSSKVEEIKRAFINGAEEVDAVVNICAIKNEDWNYVHNDIETMTQMTRMHGRIIKIIFETDLLTHTEIIKLCEICKECKVDFVKTSTGYNGKGNQPDIIQLLREQLPESIKIKASGGIQTKEQAEILLQAGAERLGCSASVDIVKE